MKRILIMLLAVCLIALSGCTAKKDAAETTGVNTTAAEATTAGEIKDEPSISLSVVFDNTVEERIKSAAKNVPDGAVVYSISENETVLDALKAVCASEDITLVETDGYVTGIAGITSGDAGANSGWMFKVNGKLAEVGANAYNLSNGDVVEWFYTADYNVYFN